jgi:hypothetical protein
LFNNVIEHCIGKEVIGMENNDNDKAHLINRAPGIQFERVSKGAEKSFKITVSESSMILLLFFLGGAQEIGMVSEKKLPTVPQPVPQWDSGG